VALAFPALTACPAEGPPQTIGLSSSLPLIWGESGDIRGQLAQDDAPHWALDLLRSRGAVVPVDTLAGTDGRMPLAEGALLVLVQPRALAPEENVALDAWVRGGGRLLLFVDPMLTASSRFALGDPRRPEAIAMLSPILRHWGLDLHFDPDQPDQEREVSAFGAVFPARLPGEISASGGSGCDVESDGIAADCRIGRGRVLVIADAAVFDGDDAGRRAAVARFLALLAD